MRTRLTQSLGIEHPVLLAPMDTIAGGPLAAAVSRAGGFGMIGGGYADDERWLVREMDAAGDARVGIGFITWSMARRPRMLELAACPGRCGESRAVPRGAAPLRSS